MNFDPSVLFTSVGTLTSVWILCAVGVVSLIGARALRHLAGGWRVFRRVAAGLLTVTGTLSFLLVLAWMFSRHS